MENEKSFACPCCGSEAQLEEEGGYEICMVCGWEDDEYQRDHPNETGANSTWTLSQAREAWRNGETIFSRFQNPNLES
ncbi:MAG: CPCC family cysteine-rich protein [Oscillospiraceae bacterium]|jgi:hypothetical protein